MYSVDHDNAICFGDDHDGEGGSGGKSTYDRVYVASLPRSTAAR